MGKESIDPEDFSDGLVSANELTGALQLISLDPREIERFHRLYLGMIDME